MNSFIAKHSFALKAKAIDIDELKKTQDKNEQETCLNRKLSKPSPVSIHNEINSNSLPLTVKNKLFFHYHHYCAVLGCKYAPIEEIEKIVADYSDYIFVLPRLEKGTIIEIEKSFNEINNKYLNQLGLSEYSQLSGYLQVAQNIKIGVLFLVMKPKSNSALSNDFNEIIKTHNLPMKWKMLIDNQLNKKLLDFKTGISYYVPNNGIEWINTTDIDGISSFEELANEIVNA